MSNEISAVYIDKEVNECINFSTEALIRIDNCKFIGLRDNTPIFYYNTVVQPFLILESSTFENNNCSNFAGCLYYNNNGQCIQNKVTYSTNYCKNSPCACYVQVNENDTLFNTFESCSISNCCNEDYNSQCSYMKNGKLDLNYINFSQNSKIDTILQPHKASPTIQISYISIVDNTCSNGIVFYDNSTISNCLFKRNGNSGERHQYAVSFMPRLSNRVIFINRCYFVDNNMIAYNMATMYFINCYADRWDIGSTLTQTQLKGTLTETVLEWHKEYFENTISVQLPYNQFLKLPTLQYNNSFIVVELSCAIENNYIYLFKQFVRMLFAHHLQST